MRWTGICRQWEDNSDYIVKLEKKSDIKNNAQYYPILIKTHRLPNAATL